MRRKNLLFVFAVIAFLSSVTPAQVPDKEKVGAGAERAFEKFAKAYVGPAPGCAAAVVSQWRCSVRESVQTCGSRAQRSEHNSNHF